jgi:hypothetical protein
MKKIDTSHIQENVRRQPFNKASFDHIQEAFQEVFTELFKGLTEQATGAVALYGCIDSDAGATSWNISVGTILYAGEVFTVPGFVGSHGSNVPVLGIVTTYRAGDPVMFSDNGTYNVHAIRTMQWTMGAPGSGLANFSALKRFKDLIKPNSIYPGYPGKVIKPIMYDIGTWNMNSVTPQVIPHNLGADRANIIGHHVFIMDDSTLTPTNFESWFTGISAPSGTFGLNSTNIVLNVTTNGLFDISSSYSGTSVNRGTVLLWLKADA